MVIGEIAYQVAYDKVGTLYHGGFISGKSAGSFFHWIIRTVVFLASWAVTYGVIWIAFRFTGKGSQSRKKQES